MASDNIKAPIDPHSVLLVVVDGQVVASATSTAIDEVLRFEVDELVEMSKSVEEAVDLLELGGYKVEIETRTYPREDVCYKCGAHVGWVVSFVGEMFALGVCDDCEPPYAMEEGEEEEDGEGAGNGSDS